jgi:hypothetical protein
VRLDAAAAISANDFNITIVVDFGVTADDKFYVGAPDWTTIPARIEVNQKIASVPIDKKKQK